MTDPHHHSLIEDAQGIAYGATMAAFGIVILTHLGLITGQTAGLAVLISAEDTSSTTGGSTWAMFWVPCGLVPRASFACVTALLALVLGAVIGIGIAVLWMR